MDHLSWELSVLAKAVGFPNLSGAAEPVGLSQSQLSRIVSKLEGELEIVLLDRAAKRKSGWMPMAHRLADIYSKSSRHLSDQIQRMVEEHDPQTLRFGTLDGLAGVASDLASSVFKKSAVKTVELDLYDLIQLEELFLKGELDLIFSSREPGRRKFRHVKRLGFQSLEEVGSPGQVRVLSPFQFLHLTVKASKRSSGRSTGTAGPTADERILISNSLTVRRHWIEAHGGQAVIPSPVRKVASGKGREEPVLLIGQDGLSPRLWSQIGTWV